VDAEWVEEWRVSVTALLAELLGTFSQRFGFDPDLLRAAGLVRSAVLQRRGP